jgi:hypothetical protein
VALEVAGSPGEMAPQQRERTLFRVSGGKIFCRGRLGRDQLLDYHVRKGMTLEEAERWL